MGKLLFITIFCAGILASYAEKPSETVDEADGDGPFQKPLEPGDFRFSAFNNDNSLQGYSVLQVVPRTTNQVAMLKRLGDRDDMKVQFWQEPSRPGNAVDMMVSRAALQRIIKLVASVGLRYKVQINDVADSIKAENPPHLGTMYSTYSGYDYGRYHQLREIHSELQNLANRYPNLASVFSIGTSHERRYMKAIKISAKKGSNRKIFFFNCGIHAREWVTPATCMYMINKMLTQYGRDQAVTAMLNKMDWVILPVFNVDGYAYTWTGNRNRLWRKTRKPSGSGCVGSDPNRNWDVNWGGVGASRNPCHDTYHGPSAFSEIEVLSVSRYLYSIRRQLVGYIDIHAYSQLWMTPWGHTTTRPRDYAEMYRVAQIAVNALQRAYRTYYRYGPSSVIIYRTTGGSNDWVYSALGVKYSYALELRDRGRYGFLLPSNQIIPTAYETFEGFKAMSAAMKI